MSYSSCEEVSVEQFLEFENNESINKKHIQLLFNFRLAPKTLLRLGDMIKISNFICQDNV